MKHLAVIAVLALAGTACQPPIIDAPAVPPPAEPADPMPPPPAAPTPVDDAAVAAATTDLRRALDEAERGDAGDIADRFERVAAAHPFVADWARLLGAERAAERGDTAAVSRLLGAVPGEMAGEWGWRARVTALQRSGDHEAAAVGAERLAGRVEWEAARARLWLMSAESRLEEGDSAAARSALVRAMEASAGSPGAVEAARTLADFPRLSPVEQLRIGRIYLRHGNLARAGVGIDAYLAGASPSAAERDALLLDLGRAHFRQGAYPDAERRLSGAAQAADAGTAAEALFLLGRAQYRQGRQDEGRATFRRVGERYPRSRWAAEALYLLADLDHDAGQMGSARELYRRVIDIAPDSEVGRVAASRLGGLHFLAGDYHRALPVFEGLQGVDAAAGGYWTGRTLERLGRTTEAETRLRAVMEADPTGYYGQLAAGRLGEGSPLRVAIAGSAPPVPEAEAAEAGRSLARLDVLAGVDRDDAAAFERGRAEARITTAGLYPFAEGLATRNRVADAVRIARGLRGTGPWNERLLRIVYPFPYEDTVTRYAQERGLDPYFVAGLIRQESLFNPVVVSPAGAIGLMQIMPATGRDLASRVGISPFDTSMLRDPELNVRLGTLFLRDMLARYDGDPVLALAAYNAGPTRATRWRELPEFRDREVFVERIPFAETRHYAKVVQANAEVYRALYGG